MSALRVALIVSLWVGLSDRASAQAGQLIELFGGMINSAIAREAAAAWQALTGAELSCIGSELRKQGTSLAALANNGVHPNDTRLIEVRAICRRSGPGPAAAPVSTSRYVVDGLTLGGRVVFDSAVYRTYSCRPSDQFSTFTWCEKKSRESRDRFEWLKSNTIVHAADGTAQYINVTVDPARFAPGEIEREIERLSSRFGERARLTRLSRQSDGSEGVIAVWGATELQRLEGRDLEILGAGKSPERGILLDFGGNFARSVKLGWPVFALTGGPGFVWSALKGDTGLGRIRFLTIDPSMLRGGTPAASPAYVANAPGTSEFERATTEREKAEAARAVAEADKARIEAQRAQDEAKQALLDRLKKEQTEAEAKQRRWSVALAKLTDENYASAIKTCQTGAYASGRVAQAATIRERRSIQGMVGLECHCLVTDMIVNENTPLDASSRIKTIIENGDPSAEAKDLVSRAVNECRASAPKERLDQWLEKQAG